jgi:tetratricopeptide (TPR) repeat protein
VDQPPEPLRPLYFALGRALAEHQRYTDAAAALEQALLEDGEGPGLADVGPLLASTRAAAGDTDGGLDAALRTLLDGRPSDVSPALQQVQDLIGHARLTAHRGLLVDPRWSALIADWLLPDGARAAAGVLLAQALLEIDETEAADQLLTTALHLAPRDPAPHHLRGRLLERLGRHDDAVAAFEAAHRRAVEADDGLADLIAIEQAQALLAAGRIDLALGCLPDLLPPDGDVRALALRVRGAALLAHGATSEALAVLTEAEALTPGNIDALLLQAQALIALHRIDDALATIDRGLQGDPTSESLQLRRWLAQVEGQTSLDATDDLQRHLRRLGADVIRAYIADPTWRGRTTDGRAHYALACLFQVLGNHDEAAASCRRALELGLGDDLPSSPEAPVQALLASALEQAGAVGDANDAHFEAGVAFYARGEWAAAAGHLETVVSRQADHPLASWYLAEVLRIQADNLNAAPPGESRPEDALERRVERTRLIERAQRVWDQAASTIPDKIEPWAYGVAALINEHRMLLEPDARTHFLWANVAYAERGLLKNRSNPFLWTTLGRAYRLLDLIACSHAASDRALESGSYDLTVFEERVILFVNHGDYELALEALDTRETLLEEDSSMDESTRTLNRAWQLGCRASVAEGRGDYVEALRLAEHALQTSNSWPWVKEITGRVHRMLGDPEAARQVFADVLARAKAGEPDWIDSEAAAEFALGRPDAALEACDRARKTSGRPASEFELTAGLCQLLRGHVQEGLQLLENRINNRVTRDDVRELRYGLRVVVEDSSGDDNLHALRAASAELTALAERRVQELAEHPGDPDAELVAIADGSDSDLAARAAAYAGLARRARERDDWETAAAWYEQLGAMADAFPDVAVAFEEVASALEDRARERLSDEGVSAAVEALEGAVDAARRAGRPPAALAAMHQALADALIARGDAGPAREQYQVALGLVDAEPTAIATALEGSLAIAGDLTGEPDPGRERLTRVLRAYAASGDGHPGLTLGQLAASLVGTIAAYSTLDAGWAAAGEDPALPDDVRAAASDARRGLATALDALLGMAASGDEPYFPVVTPLVLEIGDALVPIVDSRQDGGRFLYELVPSMRDRIQTGIGVIVPGVRARGAFALAPDAFSIQIDEAPVLTASVDPHATFRVVEGVRRDAALSDFHPLTGEPGIWAICATTDEPGHDGVPLTAAEYLVHQIERVVRAHLRRYLGPEEVSTLVAEWTSHDEELVTSVLPDREAVVRLTWVLQALADDGIPLTDWQALVTGVRDTPKDVVSGASPPSARPGAWTADRPRSGRPAVRARGASHARYRAGATRVPERVA